VNISAFLFWILFIAGVRTACLSRFDRFRKAVSATSFKTMLSLLYKFSNDFLEENFKGNKQKRPNGIWQAKDAN